MQKFDAFLHNNKPEDLGLLPLNVIYFKQIAAREPLTYPIQTDDEANFDKVIEAIKPDILTVFDIEHWRPWRDGQPATDAIIELSKFVRDTYPALRFGWWGTQGKTPEIQTLVDFTTLALYPHWLDWRQWYADAQEQLSSIETGKATYVWLRPEYTKKVGEDYNSKPLPEWQWRIMIDTVEQSRAAGIFYWGGHKMDWPENGIPV